MSCCATPPSGGVCQLGYDALPVWASGYRRGVPKQVVLLRIFSSGVMVLCIYTPLVRQVCTRDKMLNSTQFHLMYFAPRDALQLHQLKPCFSLILPCCALKFFLL